jgi:hypothetical protein
MIKELIEELRSYPEHYVAAHRAADALEKREYYNCRLEDDLVSADLETERLRKHIAKQQLDIVTLGQEVGRLREALTTYTDGCDGDRPCEGAFRESHECCQTARAALGEENIKPGLFIELGRKEVMNDLVARLRLTLSDLPGNDDDLFNEIHAQREEAAKEIVRLQDTLRHIGSVDADVIVGDHDASEMTPKDWYETGLLDGSLAVRDAVKAAARAALGEEKKA